MVCSEENDDDFKPVRIKLNAALLELATFCTCRLVTFKFTRTGSLNVRTMIPYAISIVYDSKTGGTESATKSPATIANEIKVGILTTGKP